MTKARHLKNNKKLFDTFKWKLLSSTFLWYCLLCYDKEVLPLESMDEILGCDHSNESYWAVLSCGTVYYAVQGSSNFWVCGWNPVVWSFNVSSWTVLYFGDVYHAVQSSSNFWVCGWNPIVWPFTWKLLSSTFLWCCLLSCTTLF